MTARGRALRALGWVLAVLCLAAGGGWFWLRVTLPRASGEEQLPGLSAAVRVRFDSLGIPTVRASSEPDLYAALGYLHARDRFWQMDLMRRAAEGRLAELFGSRAIAADRDARSWELGRLARRSWVETPPGKRVLFDAYARGVNAWLSRGTASMEHRLLRLRAEPWIGEDSYAILLLEAKQLHNQGGDRAGNGVRGSNSWVVAGSRTATGAPLLANDPHLPLSMPSIWYLAVLHAPGVDVAGATIPGLPGVVIGRNRAIAWGMTASYVDDVDDVEEQLSADSAEVRRRGGWVPVMVEAETLQVKGRSPIVYAQRRTANGPLIGWLASGPLRAVARRWSGQDVTPETMQASLALSRAGDWVGFRAALAAVRAPSLGLTYADTAGHIGYQLSGGVPLRPVNGVGWSAPGWTTDSAWLGYVPFDALPSALDGAPYFVTANNRIVADGYPYFLSSAWASPYRAERIRQMLRADSSVSVASTAATQMDVTSTFAQRARLVAARAATEAGDSTAAELLMGWDGAMRAGRTAPTLFWRWYVALEEELRALPGAGSATQATLHQWILRGTISRPDGAPLDLAPLATRAMQRALADPGVGWVWGRAHRLVIRHPLGDLPLVGRLLHLNIGPLDAPGGDFTVDLCSSEGAAIPFTCTEGPSMRFVADMADTAGAWFILPGGESGNVFSRHYRDQFPLWKAGRLAYLNLVAAVGGAGETLVLTPSP